MLKRFDLTTSNDKSPSTCGLKSGKCSIGCHTLPAKVNGSYYLNFVQMYLNVPLEDVSFNTRLHMFQHDSAPPHYSGEVSHLLSENYPGRCVGCGRETTLSWPARSPDFNPLDLFFGDI
jgi:hypothetical protein